MRDVPAKLRPVVGRVRLVQSLQTHDLTVAQARRWAVLASFQKVLDAARAKSGPQAPIEAGLAWRETLARIEAGDPATIAANFGHSPYWRDPSGLGEVWRDPKAAAMDHATDALHHAASGLNEADAETLLDVAHGRATPLMHYVEQWLAEGGTKGPLTPRTSAQYRADLKRLSTWAKGAGLPETVETFTKRVAGRYVTETIVTPKVDPNTGNRWISAASAYWRWLRKRAGIETDPWAGQSLAKGSARTEGGKAKRPLTDPELAALLGGSPDAELADLMRVAALSGMRLEEIYRLTVGDCAGGWFNVRVSKTEAGVRRVPIHSGLQAIVAKRTDGKALNAYLFHEAGDARDGRGRSMAVSKRFGRYRQTVNVHEVAKGRRASAVDFHSLRRWFVTAARNAGMDRAMVAAVVGHEAGNITDDVYSGGPSEALRREVVESVRLPG